MIFGIAAWLFGALVGLALGLITYFTLGKLVNAQKQDGRTNENPMNGLDIARKADLIIMPVVCAIGAHVLFGGTQ